MPDRRAPGQGPGMSAGRSLLVALASYLVTAVAMLSHNAIASIATFL